MTAALPCHPALETMRRETARRLGPVPSALAGQEVARGHHLLAGDAFLLHAEDGTRYLYRRGAGVTIDRAPGADPAAEELWLNGSVHAAVACLNGLYPLHASAVAHDGGVTAFTGPAGAGKSTLAAALGARGLPLFCDDTLLLDLSDPALVLALPGHKRLKLRPDAMALSGATPLAPVGSGTGKTYAAPLAGPVDAVQPLVRLVFLAEGDSLEWRSVSGGSAMARMEDGHQTQALFRAATGIDRAALFALRARLAAQVEMVEFVRPLAAAGMPAALDLVASRVCKGCTS